MFQRQNISNRRQGPQHLLIPGRHNGNQKASFQWDLPGPPDSFTYDLLPRYMDNSVFAPPDILFTLFLESTARAVQPGYTRKPTYASMDILLVAAKQGSPAAQAAMVDALAFYQERDSGEIQDSLVYPTIAVSIGSVRAIRHLKRMDPVALSTAIDHSGGYGKLYHIGPTGRQLHSIASVEQWAN